MLFLISSFFISHFQSLRLPKSRKPLLLPEVLASVQTQYPPYLAALIEQDIANGRVRQAMGALTSI
jgi:hypothetical protein